MELLRFYELERLTGTQPPEPGVHPHTGTTHLPCPKRGVGFGFGFGFGFATSHRHCLQPSNGA
ncbi:hypothetical protein [Streptomyces nigrescens]|uniref:Uncharacterized protein n=1 Tax=Streptomyces nigrescens TaxID=1920 RepID=A0ABY7ITZ4_STRNI|nr:hypothetical protein [Streptomyces nigrescens]WAU02354.1 hypothetical protein STRNI_000385 [Streptomyces nigrescens]